MIKMAFDFIIAAAEIFCVAASIFIVNELRIIARLWLESRSKIRQQAPPVSSPVIASSLITIPEAASFSGLSSSILGGSIQDAVNRETDNCIKAISSGNMHEVRVITVEYVTFTSKLVEELGRIRQNLPLLPELVKFFEALQSATDGTMDLVRIREIIESIKDRLQRWIKQAYPV